MNGEHGRLCAQHIQYFFFFFEEKYAKWAFRRWNVQIPSEQRELTEKKSLKEARPLKDDGFFLSNSFG